ncbi:hypothetical protein GCM10010156_04960 [Planobispora rosea]|uniref:Uncharacterized protein n=1 Tax=Planobispora rosea TaxID=35762 RepID=A0A8J3WC32_PLARO|nr:hypothetical protein GCM10010156_04960 [Planobispora rosea]GIH83780.1 hypothetical protein Pro02_21880 [Planobispora rosea]
MQDLQRLDPFRGDGQQEVGVAAVGGDGRRLPASGEESVHVLIYRGIGRIRFRRAEISPRELPAGEGPEMSVARASFPIDPENEEPATHVPPG